MSPLLEVVSPLKKHTWLQNRELARSGHCYCQEEVREKEGGRRGEENVFQLSELSAFASGMVLQGIVCGCSVLERGEGISKSMCWNQHHGTLNLHQLRSLGSTNNVASHQSPCVPDPFSHLP